LAFVLYTYTGAVNQLALATGGYGSVVPPGGASATVGWATVGGDEPGTKVGCALGTTDTVTGGTLTDGETPAAHGAYVAGTAASQLPISCTAFPAPTDTAQLFGTLTLKSGVL